MWGWAIMDSLCRVRPSVGRSVRLHYRVRCINPIPIEGFSSNLAEMFTLTREWAKPMLLMCQLNVKVTIEGQISYNQILDIMSCPHCMSYTYWKIFFNPGSNVHLNKRMCRTYVTFLPVKVKVTPEGQNMTWNILKWSCSVYKSYTNWRIFFKLG